MRSAYLFPSILFVALLIGASSFMPGNDCPKEGKTKKGEKPDEEMATLNKKKNKSAKEPDLTASTIRVVSLKGGKKPVADREFWYEGTYVEMSDAYLIDYDPEAGEQCNCYKAKKNLADPYGDIHINVGTKQDLENHNNNYFVVVELTASYKKLNPDYIATLKSLKGKKITIRGYLMYDFEHERNSVNYCKKCTEPTVSRKTCWEIHPITYIGEANN